MYAFSCFFILFGNFAEVEILVMRKLFRFILLWSSIERACALRQILKCPTGKHRRHCKIFFPRNEHRQYKYLPLNKIRTKWKSTFYKAHQSITEPIHLFFVWYNNTHTKKQTTKMQRKLNTSESQQHTCSVNVWTMKFRENGTMYSQCNVKSRFATWMTRELKSVWWHANLVLKRDFALHEVHNDRW